MALGTISISQPTTGMGRDHEVSGMDHDFGDLLLDERNPTGQTWPRGDQGLGDLGGAPRHPAVHGQRRLRSVVEKEQKMRDQAMARRKYSRTQGPLMSAAARRRTPGLEQLRARNALCQAEHPRDAMKEGPSREMLQVVVVESGAARLIP